MSSISPFSFLTILLILIPLLSKVSNDLYHLVFNFDNFFLYNIQLPPEIPLLNELGRSSESRWYFILFDPFGLYLGIDG